MSKITILTLLLFTLFACSREGGEQIVEPSGQAFEISTFQNSIKPLELVRISSEEITFEEEVYIGTLNDIEVELVRTESNTLLFSVPNELNVAQAKLVLTIGNKTGEIVFEVRQNIVQNVEALINEELLGPFSEFENELDSLISIGIYSAVVKNQLASAKQMLQEYRVKYDGLSSEEKMEVARFFNANPFFTSDFLGLANKTTDILNGNPDFDCFKYNKKRLVLTVISVAYLIEYVPHLARFGPVGPIAAIAGFVAGVYAAVSIVSAVQESLLNDCFRPFENFFQDDEGNTDDFEVYNDSEYTFTVFTKTKSIVASVVSHKVCQGRI